MGTDPAGRDDDLGRAVLRVLPFVLSEAHRRSLLRQTKKARTKSAGLLLLSRHCERSEAIHLTATRKNGLLRFARNDG
jgi:hypothetical protein